MNDDDSPTVDRQSFFQVYLPDHNSMPLGIPQPYMKNFKGTIPKTVSLKNLSGRIWPAKLEYIDKKLHISQGWNRFATENSLQSGEFLTLTCLQNSVFLIKVYGLDGSIKQEQKTSYERVETGTESTCKVADVTHVANMRFYKTILNNDSIKYLTVPKAILDSCAFELPHSIKLCNEKGQGIKTQLRQGNRRIKVRMAGLANFMRSNGVEVGDKLEFEVVCGNENKIKKIVMRNISQSEVLRRGY